MSPSETLLLGLLLVGGAVVLILSSRSRAKTMMQRIIDGRIKELVTHPKFLDVKGFNDWFMNNQNPHAYANQGIFLRLDKLSNHHIMHYWAWLGNLEIGIVEAEIYYNHPQSTTKFLEDIRTDWLKLKDEAINMH